MQTTAGFCQLPSPTALTARSEMNRSRTTTDGVNGLLFENGRKDMAFAKRVRRYESQIDEGYFKNHYTFTGNSPVRLLLSG